MEFIKKQSVSTWITLGALIMALIGAILYGVNVGAVGYYHDVTIGILVVMTILVMIMLAALLVLAQFEFDCILGKIVNIVTDVFKILIPIFLGICLVNFIITRVEGFGFILFSDESVRLTMQTPENMASVYTAISGFVFYGIAMVAAMVAAFFGLRKKEA